MNTNVLCLLVTSSHLIITIICWLNFVLFYSWRNWGSERQHAQLRLTQSSSRDSDLYRCGAESALCLRSLWATLLRVSRVGAKVTWSIFLLRLRLNSHSSLAICSPLVRLSASASSVFYMKLKSNWTPVTAPHSTFLLRTQRFFLSNGKWLLISVLDSGHSSMPFLIFWK